MFTYRVRSGLLVCAATALAGISCSKSDSTSPGKTPPPSDRLSVVFQNHQDTVVLGTSKLLQTRVVDALGAPKSAIISWQSLQPSIVTVANGLVTAIGAGQARVVASVGASSDTATVTVTAPNLEVRIWPTAVAAALGDTLHFEAEVYAAGNRLRNATINWQVSDSTAATIIAGGSVSTQTPADVQLTARVAEAFANATIQISQAVVGSVTISPSSSNLTVGAALTLRATVRDQSGRKLPKAAVKWTSSDPTIATIGDEGVVRALARGGVVITAESGGQTATATVNVSSAAATSVVLSLPSNSISVGQTMQASATAYDAAGKPMTGRTMAWQSSIPSVATINSKGVITAMIAGATTISVICDGLVSSSKLYVVAPVASDIVVSPGSATLVVGESAAFTAAVRDQQGQPIGGQTVSWTSANPSVASVSSTGAVLAVGNGSTTITAHAGSLSGSASVAVQSVPVASLSVSPTSLSLAAGQSSRVTATSRDASGNVLADRVVTWSSSNTAIATVSNGTITGVAAGQAVVTATADGNSATVAVTVTESTPAVAAVTLTLGSNTLDIGQSTQAVYHAFDAQGQEITSSYQPTWGTANSSIATISGTGLVTAVASGSDAISVMAGGVKALAAVTVAAPSVAPVATVTLSAPKTSLFVGDSSQLSVVLKDVDGNVLTGRSIGYASSNSAILSVSPSGMVRAYGAGAATITAVSETKTGTLGFSMSLMPVASVSVSLGANALNVGQTTQAVAILKDAGGHTLTGRTIVWTSTNPTSANVSSTGLVTAVAAGTASITATSEGMSGSASVSVTTQTLTVATVQVALTTTTLLAGQSTAATAVAKTSSGQILTGKSVTWTVSAGANVVSVAPTTSTSTTVTGTTAGTAIVTPVIDGVAGSATVTVTSSTTTPSPVALPALPTVYLNPTYPQVTGRQWLVRAGDNLQTALNNAQRGDEVVLQAGATFTGNFVLPAKAGTAANGWIIVRSEQLSQLPAGLRVTPSQATLMPKIVTPGVAEALSTAISASGWYMAGIEITIDPQLTIQQYGIVSLGWGGGTQNSLASVATDLVMDRVFIHGQTGSNTSRCVALNSARTTIMNSYLSECHGRGFDSQAIAGWNGPGPFKIVNNTLMGAGENVMFGGADPVIPGLIPSDIEIRNNFIYTPLAWEGVWTKKNLFELKNAQRLLLDGNVLDGSWTDGQVGTGIALKSSNQSGQCTWCVTRDITLRNNVLRNVGQPFNLAGHGNTNTVGDELNRVLIENMVVERVNISGYMGDPRFILLLTGVRDVTIRHNTMTTTATFSTFTTIAAGVSNVVIDNNVFARGTYGLMADGGYVGTAAINTIANTKSFNYNVIVGSSNGTYPTTTTWVSSLSAAQTIIGVGASTTLTSSLSGLITP